MTEVIEQLRYPIGPYVAPTVITADIVALWIDEIEALPSNLRGLVSGLSDEHLDSRYRPDGWTVRQVVHHLADSHMNSMIRFRWAVTEDRPRIKPYFEDRVAALPDYQLVPVDLSLDLLDALHRRWGSFLRLLGPEELSREFIHPETGVVRLDWNIGLYAWHGRHHCAHIANLIERSGW